MPPRYLLEKTVEQCRGIAEPAGEANVFGRPATEMPGAIRAGRPRAPARRDRRGRRRRRCGPAYRRLADFIAGEYAPKGRTEMGVWSLPDGERRYRFAVRQLTTTDMDPEEIHELGLREVARIEAEQDRHRQAPRLSRPGGFRASLKTDRQLFATSREQLLERAPAVHRPDGSQAARACSASCPRCRSRCGRCEEYREKEAAGGRVPPRHARRLAAGRRVRQHRRLRAALHRRGSRPWRTTRACPGTTCRCPSPQTLPALPPFRQHAYYGAYTEGWALYAERLGKEIGFYEDPYLGLRAPVQRAAARGQAGPRHRGAPQALEPRADGGLLPGPLRRGRARPSG